MLSAAAYRSCTAVVACQRYDVFICLPTSRYILVACILPCCKILSVYISKLGRTVVPTQECIAHTLRSWKTVIAIILYIILCLGYFVSAVDVKRGGICIYVAIRIQIDWRIWYKLRRFFSACIFPIIKHIAGNRRVVIYYIFISCIRCSRLYCRSVYTYIIYRNQITAM